MYTYITYMYRERVTSTWTFSTPASDCQKAPFPSPPSTAFWIECPCRFRVWGLMFGVQGSVLRVKAF